MMDFIDGKKTYAVAVMAIIDGLALAYTDYKTTHSISAMALTKIEFGFGLLFLRAGVKKAN